MEPARKRILWLAVGLLALCLLAWPKVHHGSAKAAGNHSGGTGAKGPPGKGSGGTARVQVAAYVVRPRSIEEKITGTGTLKANEEIQLKSETAGKIVGLPLQEGSHVPKGALLVKINDADLKAQLTKARAAFRLAQDVAARQKKLLERSFISQQEYEQAMQAVEAARGDIDLIKAQIQKTEIRAPFDGVVGLKLVSLGGYLAPGAPIANFVSDLPLKVDFSVPEQYYDSISPGKKVAFKVQGDRRLYAARVYAVDPMVDESTRTVEVRAMCDSVYAALAPGTFAELSLVIKEKPRALLVPSQAIVPGMTSQAVYVLRRGQAVSQTVHSGLRTDADVEIVDGVRPGDTVITSGMMLVHPGSQVDIKSLD